MLYPPAGGEFGLALMEAVGSPSSTITKLRDTAKAGEFIIKRAAKPGRGGNHGHLRGTWALHNGKDVIRCFINSYCRAQSQTRDFSLSTPVIAVGDDVTSKLRRQIQSRLISF
jgi:hypothetical protein